MSELDRPQVQAEMGPYHDEKKSTPQLSTPTTIPEQAVNCNYPGGDNAVAANSILKIDGSPQTRNDLIFDYKSNFTSNYIPEYVIDYSNSHNTQPQQPLNQPLSQHSLESSNTLHNGQFIKTEENFKYLSGHDKIGEYLASNANFPLLHDDFTKELDHTLDPHLKVRIQSLPVLDNLSCQILRTLTKNAHEETLMIVTKPHTDRGQAYRMLVQLFEQTKRLYSEDYFLSMELLGSNFAKAYTRVIQKANLAFFMATIYGSTQLGFQYLNEHFLDILIPDSGRLLKLHGVLYLDLKTQAYISAISHGNKSRLEALKELFPENLDEILLNRRRVRNWKQLAPSEIDFIARCKARRDRLYEMSSNQELAETYVWLTFLRELSEFICKNLDYLITPHLAIVQTKPDNILLRIGSSNNHYVSQQEGNRNSDVDASFCHKTLTPKKMQRPQLQFSQRFQRPNSEQAESGPSTYQYTQEKLEQQSNVTSRTSTLFSTTKTSVPSPRRPWTKEEETTLLDGLEVVQGPHWSQILEMYGRGGRINEILKDRNQVQLKDKARNLKLYYLKSNMEIPYYLQLVTGDIKSRKKTNRASRIAKKK
ncbi:hypothetical protein NADFUDRAFT_52225 [Nadsonia fulvescens var. elongata DSM 6958]|uniref:Uncharacterized protein n=1 Tax=Nadsonia fulvescens var. elongata DSM 6958 TaxID=857566 RepID=A0A1E3PH06_9ASCO|nr:hypothetical protein NADFUDRAFT_52225 [Nadsonia fulvescens var. elongata DSM 6958]